MMTSSRPAGDLGGSFTTRRGHSSQLSISDPSHHVTEAIGTLYGDEDDSGSDSGRPLSFVGGQSYQDQIFRLPPRQEPQDVDPRRHLLRSQSEQTPGPSTSTVEMGSFKKSQTLPARSTSQRSPHSLDYGSKSPGAPLSPTPSLRDFQSDGSKFPLTNIDNPSDIAQELSNLQALRRMSMDVGNMTDPDMPPMTLSAIPAIAPSGDDDENDPSRLLWVPARVHPELAPSEFQTFLEKRVQSIRRRSGESFLSADGDLQRSDSGSSLGAGAIRRQKSKLSRQIDNSGGRGAVGYVDGAERLERKRSQGHTRELSLDELVKDPTKAVQKLAQESQDHPAVGEGSSNDDKPILPMAPGMGLRRSTRTTYRKGGSLRSGDRLSSRRSANRNQDGEASEPLPPPLPDAPPGHGLSRVQSEPISDNYSHPSRSVRRQNKFAQDSLPTLSVSQDEVDDSQLDSFEPTQSSTQRGDLPIRTSSSDQSLTGIQYGTSSAQEERPNDQYDDQYDHYQPETSRSYPQRSSSQAISAHAESQPESPPDEPPARSSRRVNNATSSNQNNPQPPAQVPYTSKTPSATSQPQNLSDSLGAYSGAAASRTDNLTFIPTFSQEERRSDKKSRRDEDAGSVTSTKTSGSGWKWFKSGNEDKKKEESKKSKTKSLVEKAQDNVRLDVIQNSIDKNATKGRESLVLDRDNMDSKLQEERKKESSRKSDGKKEKDGNIFSSIFGGKRKEEREKSSKKNRHLEVPDEPVYKPLQPDVDYHWTRFPLLEERAIYRMAHIKLANPRRSLLSQVLLSNFMYSYLAIVQAMHPQMNVPTSPQQKRLEEEARRKQQEEEYLAQQQMQDDQDSGLGQYDYDYHRAAVQYADSGNGQVDYVDDAQIYEDEHGRDSTDYAYEGSDGYGQGSKEYYQYHGNGDDRRHDRRDEMW